MASVKNKPAEWKVTRATGFTFIEVMVALAIVSISMLALLRLHLISIRMADNAQKMSQAVFLAEQKIAETLTEGYPKEGSNCGSVEQNGALFNWRTNITDIYAPQLGEAGITGLREILVDVSWKQGVGHKHLQMSTCVADGRMK